MEITFCGGGSFSPFFIQRIAESYTARYLWHEPKIRVALMGNVEQTNRMSVFYCVLALINFGYFYSTTIAQDEYQIRISKL